MLNLFVQIQGLTHTYILSDLKVDVHEIIYEISILFCRLFPQEIFCFERFFLLQSFFEVKLDVNSLKFRKRLIFFLSKYLCFHFFILLCCSERQMHRNYSQCLRHMRLNRSLIHLAIVFSFLDMYSSFQSYRNYVSSTKNENKNIDQCFK